MVRGDVIRRYLHSRQCPQNYLWSNFISFTTNFHTYYILPSCCHHPSCILHKAIYHFHWDIPHRHHSSSFHYSKHSPSDPKLPSHPSIFYIPLVLPPHYHHLLSKPGHLHTAISKGGQSYKIGKRNRFKNTHELQFKTITSDDRKQQLKQSKRKK